MGWAMGSGFGVGYRVGCGAVGLWGYGVGYRAMGSGYGVGYGAME